MKQLEISKLSKEDLTDKLLDYKKQLSDLRMNHAISPLENPMQIKIFRRVIARINTALKNKEA
tara:strand:+ start:218 stop:406 length:189 start_codon:yes stop_codon:yes gene_type:complete